MPDVTGADGPGLAAPGRAFGTTTVDDLMSQCDEGLMTRDEVEWIKNITEAQGDLEACGDCTVKRKLLERVEVMRPPPAEELFQVCGNMWSRTLSST